MPLSMLDALKDMKVQDVSPVSVDSPMTKSKMRGAFAAKVEAWANQILKDYFGHQMDLNTLIANIAQKNNLSSEQISRIIEEVNSEVYLTEYEKSKGKPNREVKFVIAELPKIKDLMGNNAKANQQPVKEPDVGGVETKMDKKANMFEDDGDKLSFLNYTTHDTSGLAEDKRVPREEYLRRTLADKVAAVYSEYEAAFLEHGSDLDCMADALIGYEKLGHDAVEIFTKICNDAELQIKYQYPIIKATTEKIASLVEERHLHESFSINLQPVDFLQQEKGLSLGKHSLLKQAREDQNNSNKELPNVKTNKKLIKGYKDLVQMAKKVQQSQSAVEAATAKKEKIASILE